MANSPLSFWSRSLKPLVFRVGQFLVKYQGEITFFEQVGDLWLQILLILFNTVYTQISVKENYLIQVFFTNELNRNKRFFISQPQ